MGWQRYGLATGFSRALGVVLLSVVVLAICSVANDVLAF
jgi:hypothetical protein